MAKERIIIVEGESQINPELEYKLGQLGYMVCAKAHHTEEALKAVRDCNPDLILIETGLTGPFDGIETAKQILAIDHYPIVFITTHTDAATFDRAKKTMPYGYLSKPVNERDLLITLEMAIHKSRTEKELRETRKTLLENQEQLAIITANLPGIVFQFAAMPDGKMDITFADGKIEEMLGIDRNSENLFNQFAKQIHPDFTNLFIQSVDDALKNFTPWSFEGKFNKPSGEPIWIRGLSTPFKREPFMVFNGIIFDITEQKQVDQKIKKLNRLDLVRSNINQSIVRLKDRDTLFREVCKIAVQDGKFIMVWIGIVNQQTNCVDVAASYGKTGSYLDHIDIDLNNDTYNHGPTGLAIQTGQLNYCKDIENDERMSPWRTRALNLGYRSSISLPIKMFGYTFGTMSLYSDEVDFFKDEDEIKLLEELTANISFALEFMEQDIQRKQAEDALKESEERFRSLYENSTMGLYRTTPDGQILLANPTLVKMLGFNSFEELANRDLEKVSYVDTNKRIEFQNFFKENDELTGFESEWYRNDGSIVSVSESTKAVRDETGKIIYYDGTVEDITKRKLAEKKLKESEEKYRLLAESSPEMIYLIDTNGHVVYVNQTAAGQFHAPASELVGKHLTEIFPPGLAQKNLSEIQGVIATKSNLQNEVEMVFPTGSKWVDARLTPVFDEEKNVIGVMGLSYDITERKIAEKQIREYAEQYELIKSTELFGYWLIDEKGNIIDVNDTYCRMSGFTREELLKLSIPDIEVNDKPDDVAARIRRIIINGIEQFESKHKARDGHAIDVEIHVAYWASQRKFITLIRDITERRQAEFAVNESEKKFRTVIESSPSAIFIVQDWKFAYVNSSAEALTGYGFEEITGKNFLELVHPNQREMVRKNAEDRLSGLPALDRYYLQYITKNGESRWLDFSPQVIKYEGKPAIMSTGIDITERKKAEDKILKLNETLESRVKERTFELQQVNESLAREIAEREQVQLEIQKLSQAMEQAPAIVIITDNNGTIEYTNPVFTSVTGYSSEEVKGENPRILKSGYHPASFYDEIWETITSGNIWEGDIHNKKKNGELYWESASISPIFSSDGKITHFVAVKTDITFRKKMEAELQQAMLEAEQANRAKSEFLSRMSHELRTPMNSILGFAQLMDMGELPPAHNKGVDHILKSGKHLLDLINEVLDISKIESGHMSLSYEPIDVCQIMKEVTDVVSPLTAKDQIALEIIQENNLFVKADRQRLKQVLINLLSNAIKYNKKNGFVKINCEMARAEENPDSLVRISISDSGVGITPDDIKKLFNPFERIGAEKTKTEGTGLGLAVTKKLVEAMNGTIGVESEAGLGSTFWIELPLADSQIDRYERLRGQVVPEQGIGLVKGTILYVEDNFSNIQLIEQILENHRPGIRLISEIYGRNAVKLATDFVPNIILLDLDLPDMHGDNVLKLLKENINTQSIPVVVISANAMGNKIEKLIKGGAKGYLTKPLDVMEFLRVVDEMMKAPFQLPKNE